MEVKVESGSGHVSIAIEDPSSCFGLTLSDVGAGVDSIRFKGEEMSANAFSYRLCKGYFGRTIAPVAGRIKGARYELGEKGYRLEANEGANSLHSSSIALSFKRWDYKIRQDEKKACVIFSFPFFPDAESYPGEVEINAVYTVTSGVPGFDLVYVSTPKRDSPLNLTNHLYFDLGETGLENISFRINASFAAYYDGELLPLGVKPVSPALDFRRFKPVTRDILAPELQTNPRLKGYDHAFVFDGPIGEFEARGRRFGMKMLTSAPAVQVFTSNSPSSLTYASGRKDGRYASFACEPVKRSDRFDSFIVKAGEKDVQTNCYRFFEIPEEGK